MRLEAIILDRLKAIFREPEGLLRHPYVDPGGPYGKNLWDWDSFWCLKTALAMAATHAETDAWRQQVVRCAAGVLDNYFDHQGDDGSLPILMTPEDADWFDSTTDRERNMAKPVFGQLMAAWAGVASDPDNITRWCKRLQAFYDCYERRYRHETGLYVWADDVAIGCDDDPSTWGRPPFSSANLLLNNLLYADLTAAAATARGQSLMAYADVWQAKADALATALRLFCWDERDGFYYTVDVQCRQRTRPHRVFGVLNENLKPHWQVMPVKWLYWTGFLPLWTGVATPEQAERMVRNHLLREDRFWSACGVRTLSADERMYDPVSARGNPSNWIGPVWILSNVLVWEGLRRYGFMDEAHELAERTIRLLEKEYREQGHWHENYHPDTGQGIAAPGFVSWNALVYFMVKDRKDMSK